MNSSNFFVRETTTMAVFKFIKNEIITGAFRPGEWIRERKIQEVLNVSSTPVREALKMLVQEGILISIPHKGVQVKSFNEKELQDFYELRSEIEGLASELAAIRRTEKQLQKLKSVLEQSEEEFQKNEGFAIEAVHFNNEFHHLIAEASLNQSIVNTLSQMRSEVDLLRVLSWKNNKTRPIITLQQHRQIFDAIDKRDGEAARLYMQEHIRDSAVVVLQVKELRNEHIPGMEDSE